MLKSKTLNIFIIFLFAILCVNLTSAAIIIAGKTYDPAIGGGNEVSGADVTIVCDNLGFPVSRTTVSLPDGSYAIGFNPAECSLPDEMTISFLKGDRYGDPINFIVNPHVFRVGGDWFSVENLVLYLTKVTPTPTPDNGGGGGGGGGSCTYDKEYDWECSEWGECVEGIQARSCNTKNNCGNTYGRPDLAQSCEVSGGEEGETSEEEQAPGFFAGITGAVTGALGTVGSWIIIIFIIGLIGLTIVVKVIRKKEETPDSE